MVQGVAQSMFAVFADTLLSLAPTRINCVQPMNVSSGIQRTAAAVSSLSSLDVVVDGMLHCGLING